MRFSDVVLPDLVEAEEEGTLPKKVGCVNISLFPNNRRKEPLRDGATIFLPRSSGMCFIPLQKGIQFILIDLMDYPQRVWFGGTDIDNNIFLTRLKEDDFSLLPYDSSCIVDFNKTWNEVEFYEALKPDVIDNIERLFGVIPNRQGDIFAVKLPYSWDEIRRAHFICCGYEDFEKIRNGKLFGTRHQLKGKCFRAKIFGKKDNIIGEGVLGHPNHPPLKLKGPHLFAQASGLYEPKLAD